MGNTNGSNLDPLNVSSGLTMVPCSVCNEPVILIDHRRRAYRFECEFVVLKGRATCGDCALDAGVFVMVPNGET
jgi:hypothetical protein